MNYILPLEEFVDQVRIIIFNNQVVIADRLGQEVCN